MKCGVVLGKAVDRNNFVINRVVMTWKLFPCWESLTRCLRIGGVADGGCAGGWGGRFDEDDAHHSFVFVLEQMAVVGEGADGVGIAEVDANADAGVGKEAAV